MNEELNELDEQLAYYCTLAGLGLALVTLQLQGMRQYVFASPNSQLVRVWVVSPLVISSALSLKALANIEVQSTQAEMGRYDP